MVRVKTHGSFNKLEKMLTASPSQQSITVLTRYAKAGLKALIDATPVLTGLAASSWSYEVGKDDRGFYIRWLNNDIEGGPPVVLLLQYGHATRSGTWVEGRDFINPAIQPIMDDIAEKAWKEMYK